MFLKSTSLSAAVCACLLVAVSGYGAPNDFQFRKIDLQLLDEVNAFDPHIDDKGFVYPDRGLTAYLQGITARLLGGRPTPERVQYQVRVLRDSTVTAFGLPNGSIYLSTGMLAVLETEGQAATILGREIAHIANRHQYLQNRQARNKAIVYKATAAAAIPLAGTAPLFLVQQSFAGRWIYGDGYSEDKESDADRDGMALTRAAGYEPQSATRAFELLDEKLEIEPVATPYRRHDKLEKRIEGLSALAVLSSAGSPRDDATDKSDYLSRVADAVCYNIMADLESRRARTAVARARRLVNWKPDRPEYQVLLADAYRALGAKTSEPTEGELSYDGTHYRRQLLRMTPEEEQAKLLAKHGGADLKKANEATAEKLYLEAITRQPSLPAAHRGLGMLYQEQSRNDEAVYEFRRYLEVAPSSAADRLRIQGRLDELDKIRQRPVRQP
jgi:predicted Zn-dependent protease